MTKQLHEDYMCDACGLTTPVPNETCPNCGAPMSSLGPDRKNTEPTDEELSDDTLHADAGSESGSYESLEALREEEGEDDSDQYNNDSFGDDE